MFDKKENKSVIDDPFITTIAAIVAAFIVFLAITGIPYGNGTQYDVINPTNQFIDENGNYHFGGLLRTGNCGNFFDHMITVRGYTFTVSEELFYKSFDTNRMTLSYQCRDGRIEDIKWGV
jgi:hypothetical protein